MPVWSEWRVVLNDENHKYAWVTTPEFLVTIMAETRQSKYLATCDAIKVARNLGLLQSWDCSSFTAIRQEQVAA